MNSSLMAAVDNGLALLVIMLCLVMLSVAMLRRSQQRQATARQVAREQVARLRDQRELHQSMDDLLVQLEEVSRRVSAQVDTRFAKLEAVIREADERIARLEQLFADSAPRKAAPHRPTALQADATPRDGVASADSTPQESGTQEVTMPRGAQSTASSSCVGPGTYQQRRQRVYEMADAGASAIVIADALQMPLGEVELLLNLRNFK